MTFTAEDGQVSLGSRIKTGNGVYPNQKKCVTFWPSNSPPAHVASCWNVRTQRWLSLQPVGAISCSQKASTSFHLYLCNFPNLSLCHFGLVFSCCKLVDFYVVCLHWKSDKWKSDIADVTVFFVCGFFQHSRETGRRETEIQTETEREKVNVFLVSHNRATYFLRNTHHHPFELVLKGWQQSSLQGFGGWPV